MLLGALTGVLEHVAGGQYAGIGVQAIIGTAGVFVGMLVVYKTGAVRVTPRFTKWLIGALVGVIVLMLVNLVLEPLRQRRAAARPGPLAIIFSLVVIGVAAFSLLLDFDQADQADQGRRARRVRLVHRLRADDHAGVALHRDPAPAQLPPRVAEHDLPGTPSPADGAVHTLPCGAECTAFGRF